MLSYIFFNNIQAYRNRVEIFIKGTEGTNKRITKMVMHGINAIFGGKQILKFNG
jgi:hypothetical protein